MRHHLLAIISFFCICFPFNNNGLAAAAQFDDEALLLAVPAMTASPRPSAQGVIGPGGGTVASGQVGVTAPAGAFGADTAVRLAGQRTRPDFVGAPDSLVWTAAIDVQGWSQPLSLCLGQVGGPDRELPVALSDVLVVDSERSEQRPAIVAGQVRNGRLCVELPPNDGTPFDAPRVADCGDSPADVHTWREITFWKITGFETLRSDHFRLYYPAKIAAYPEDIPQQILNFAEKAYAKLAAMGFAANGLTFPVSVTVQSGMGTTDGETGVPLSGKAGQYLNLNADICAPDFLERLQVTIGHEYFHVIQNLYNPRSALAIRHPWATPYFLLLSEASSVWFEGVMLDSASYVSKVFEENMQEYLNGLGTGSAHAAIQSRGYWASGFLRYLRDAQGGDAFVHHLWQAVQAQGAGTSGLSDLGALIDTAGGITTTSANWLNFIDKAAGKTAYAGWDPLPTASTVFLKPGNQPYIPYVLFSESIEPFSGRVWKVNFNYLEASDTKWIAVAKAADNIAYTLYKGQGHDGFARLGTLAPGEPFPFTASQGNVFMAVAANGNASHPYRTLNQATVYFKLDSEPQYCLSVPHGWPKTEVDGLRTWKHPTGGYTVAEEQYDGNDSAKPMSATCYDLDSGEKNLAIIWQIAANFDYIKYMYTEYKGLLRHGLHRIYYGNGNIWIESHYENDLLSGGHREYYEDGSIKMSGDYCITGNDVGRIGKWYFNFGSPYTCTYATCGWDRECKDTDSSRSP